MNPIQPKQKKKKKKNTVGGKKEFDVI